MAATGLVENILNRVRRRHLANLALNQGSLAVCVGAGGAILLLFVGTQILNWYWPVLLVLIALAIGAVRIRRAAVADYRLTQIVDARLGLADRLSTVYYFRHINPSNSGAVDDIESQAASRVNDADVVRAMPISIPRSAYAACALLAMCAGMLALRYGLLRSLDLSRPIAHIEFSPFHEPPQVQAATKKSVIQERLEEQLKQLGMTVDDPQSQESESIQPQQEGISAVPSPEGEPAPGEQGQSTGEKGPANEGEDGEAGEKGEVSKGEPNSNDAAEGDSAQQAKGDTPQKTPPQNSNKGGDQNSGLMDKMRDALANLMNKLKTPQREQGNQQSASNQNQQGSQQTPGQKGMQSPGRSQSEGQPNGDQEGEREGDGEKIPGNQNRTAEKSGDRPGNQDAKSGMGKQDGAKDIKEAEQLAAMGKISEIFGKRAQQINGEMTIEVPSGKQQLKTAYTDRQAAHSGVGSDVNRDEIPLAYQPYVQRYFEEVRKLPIKPKNGQPGPAPTASPQQAPGTLDR